MSRLPSPLRRLIDATNRQDMAAVAASLAPGIVFVDGKGHRLVGRDDCLVLMDRLFEADLNFRIEIEDVTRNGTDYLLRGCTHADVPELAQRVLWRSRIADRLVCLWEAHSADLGLTVIEALAADRMDKAA